MNLVKYSGKELPVVELSGEEDELILQITERGYTACTDLSEHAGCVKYHKLDKFDRLDRDHFYMVQKRDDIIQIYESTEDLIKCIQDITYSIMDGGNGEDDITHFLYPSYQTDGNVEHVMFLGYPIWSCQDDTRIWYENLNNYERYDVCIKREMGRFLDTTTYNTFFAELQGLRR